MQQERSFVSTMGAVILFLVVLPLWTSFLSCFCVTRYLKSRKEEIETWSAELWRW